MKSFLNVMKRDFFENSVLFFTFNCGSRANTNTTRFRSENSVLFFSCMLNLSLHKAINTRGQQNLVSVVSHPRNNREVREIVKGNCTFHLYCCRGNGFICSVYTRTEPNK